MSFVDDSDLLFDIHPQTVGIRRWGIAVNAGWPFPSRFRIYRDGLYFRAFGEESFVPREAIELLQHSRGLGYVRCSWRANDGTTSAALSDWFRIHRILAALEDAGYQVTTA